MWGIKFLNSKGINNETIKKFGIYSKENIIFFPVNDSKKNLVCIKTRLKGEKIKMPYGSHISLYGIDKALDELKAGDKIIITEGETDALALWSKGYRAITSTGGVMSFKESWATKLLLTGAEIYIMFDNDFPGHQGMAKIWQFLPYSKYVFLTEENDISDYIANGGDVETLLATAGYIEDGFYSHLDVPFKIPKPSKVKKEKRDFSEDFNQRIRQAKNIPFNELVNFKHSKAICPFHSDTTPSLSWESKKNIVKCFVCGNKAMDTIEFIKRTTGKSFVDSVLELTKN